MRLIDADALKLSHCKECTLYPDKCMGKDCDWGAIIHINAMPTIDAVPAVRCKDCKRYIVVQLKQDGEEDKRYKPTYCCWHATYMPPNGFCSSAVRRDE